MALEISDFAHHSPVEPEVIEEYRDRVPEQLVELWEEYGYGTFAQGFIRMINPKQYEEAIGDCIGKTQGDGISIPVMVTGLGDLICWEPSVGFVVILFRYDDTRGIGSKVSTLIRLVDLGGASHLSRVFSWDIFPEAVAAHGELAFDECFSFVPYLSLGGKEVVENLHKRDTVTAIQVITEFQGVVGH